MGDIKQFIADNVLLGARVEVRDDDTEDWVYTWFIAYDEGSDYPYICTNDYGLGTFEATRWLQMKL